jgi:hypothetical protein
VFSTKIILKYLRIDYLRRNFIIILAFYFTYIPRLSRIFVSKDKRSVTQETEEAEKQCIASVSRILQKRLKGNSTTSSLTD